MGDAPIWAPDEMPELAHDPDNEVRPFLKRWAAAQMKTGAYAVCVEETFDAETGKALTVAMCPSGEFAQYIAYFHNMLLMGSEMLETSIEEILKGYVASGPNDTRPLPDMTGGYL